MKKEPFEEDTYYHIFNRGNNKENIFKSEENYMYFLDLIKKYLIDYIDIYAFCFHLIVRFKSNKELDFNRLNKMHLPLSNMFNAYTKAINKRYKRTGSLFQEHLHRIKITNDDYLKNLILYVHLNPENHGLINDFREYKYSSYNAYISNKNTLLKRNFILEFFDNQENFIFTT